MKIGIDLDGVVIDSETTFRTYEELYDLLRSGNSAQEMLEELRGNNLDGALAFLKVFVLKDIEHSINLYEDLGLSGKYEEFIEIINPVYYQEPEPLEPQNVFTQTKSGSWNAHNKVCIGLTWYIFIMLLAIIFKDRLIIWVFTTIVFFVWKSKQ